MSQDTRPLIQKTGLWLALAALLLISFLPQPEGLPVAGFDRRLALKNMSYVGTKATASSSASSGWASC